MAPVFPVPFFVSPARTESAVHPVPSPFQSCMRILQIPYVKIRLFPRLWIAELARVGVLFQRPCNSEIQGDNMRPSLRLPFMLPALMIVFCVAVSSYGQKPATDAEATAAIANGQAGFNNPVVHSTRISFRPFNSR
jgi:hypothetical protein